MAALGVTAEVIGLVEQRVHAFFEIFGEVVEEFEPGIGFLGNEASFFDGGLFFDGRGLFRSGFLGNEATLLLQFGERGEGFVEAALGGIGSALDQGHEAVIDPLADVGGSPGDGFEVAEAAHAPEALGEFVDQDFLGGVGGLVFRTKSSAERIEFGGIFAWGDEVFRIETVFEGVLRGAGSAGDTFRTRGEGGVGAIDIGAGERGGLGVHEFQTCPQDKEEAFGRAESFRLND